MMNRFFLILLVCNITLISTLKPGGFQNLDVEAAATESVAKFAVRELGSKYKLVEIVSGKKQVVNGEKYKLKLKVEKKTRGEKKKRRCTVVVLMMPHYSYKELEEFHCYLVKEEI